MTQNEVIQRLQTIFDNVFIDEVTVTPELSAKEVEEWDSLTHISLIVAIEKAFGIRFRIGEVEATPNVGEFSELLAKRVGEQTGNV